MNRYQQLLESCGVTKYEINESATTSIQHFYVLDKCETSRYGQTKDTVVTVYMDQNDQTGSASFSIYTSDDDPMIIHKIEQAKINASLALNPYYDLQQKQDGQVNPNTTWDGTTMAQLANQVAHMIYTIPHHSDVWVNSVEIFVNQKQTHFLNSYGVDLTNTTKWIEVELIPTSRNGFNEEFELYLDVVDDNIEDQIIHDQVRSILNTTLDRAHCLELPKHITSLPVMISGEMRDMVVKALAINGSYQTIYEKRQHYDIGQTIGNDNISISIKGKDDHVIDTNGFDTHGTLIHDTMIIDHGIVVNSFGNIQYGAYLGVNHITGDPSIVSLHVDHGYTKDDLTQDYLEIIHFSSPQLIQTSGYFGGEVRLAYFHHDGKKLPVSGFSISGNLYELVKTMQASDDTIGASSATHGYVGPTSLLFESMAIH